MAFFAGGGDVPASGQSASPPPDDAHPGNSAHRPDQRVPVRALDTTTGETRWSQEVPFTGRGEFLDDADAVYVESSSAVGALEPDDGLTRWLYDVGNETVADSRVADGVAYVATTERLAAITDWTEQWPTAYDLGRADFDTTIIEVSSGTMFVVIVGTEGQLRLYALDVATGDVT